MSRVRAIAKILKMSENPTLHRWIVLVILRTRTRKFLIQHRHRFDPIYPEQLPLMVLAGCAGALHLKGAKQFIPIVTRPIGVRLDEPLARIIIQADE